MKRELRPNLDLYLIALIPCVYFLLFKYAPLFGTIIAFKDFVPSLGIIRSPWVGLRNFGKFFGHYIFWNIFKNTILLALYSLVAGFPMPIILAISLSHLGNRKLKKTIQMVTYAPHFISVVVVCGIIAQILSPRFGVVNMIIKLFGREPVNFLGRAGFFRSIYVWSDIWQHVGWHSIIYLAALASVDPQLHEAAIIDGATILRRIRTVDLPGILPTVTIVLILNTGRIMQIGFEKVLLLQNPLNITVSEIIQTYVYKVGFSSEMAMPNFSYAAAIELFNSAINFMLLFLVNSVARRISETSLW